MSTKSRLVDRPIFTNCAVAALAIACMPALATVYLRTSSSTSPNELSAHLSLPTHLQGNATDLPTPLEHWIGDLDGMVKRQKIRALVVYSKSAFFYDNGQPEGISFEALQEFQRVLNSLPRPRPPPGSSRWDQSAALLCM
jgi:hypothetical protein